MPAATSEREMVVAIAGDQNYFPGVLVCACSVAFHAARTAPLRLLILDGGIADASYARLESQVRKLRPDAIVSRVVVEKFLAQFLKERGRLHPMAYARIVIPDLVAGGRVLYLDADTIVLGDLDPLFEMDPGGAVALAIRDPGVRVLRNDCPWLSAGERLDREPYFNTGVLAMAIEPWREARASEQAGRLLREEVAHCHWGDQTVLNYVLRDKIRYLPDTWNRASAHYFFGRRGEPRIIHFMWPVKPWAGIAESDAYRIWRSFATKAAGVSEDELRLSLADKLKVATAPAYVALRCAGAQLGSGILRLCHADAAARKLAREARHWRARLLAVRLRASTRAVFQKWLRESEARWAAAAGGSAS